MRALFLLLAGCSATPSRWQPMNAEVQTSKEGDKDVVTIAPVGGNHKGSNTGLLLLAGTTLDEGTIDVDIRGLGEQMPSFVGVAFGVADATHYEAVYFRPFRFRATAEPEHSHAIQYIAWPEHTWEALRMASPGVYESAITPVPDPATWFHARIEVAHAKVKVFVNGATQPSLEVTRLATRAGGVGLFVDSQPGSFANLAIHAR